MIELMVKLKYLAIIIDFAGSLLVFIASFLVLIKYFIRAYNLKEISRLHYNFANVMVFSLTVKSGAALINSMMVGSWQQFLWFLVIVSLRFMLRESITMAKT